MRGGEKYSHKLMKKIRCEIPDVPGALGKLAAAIGDRKAILGDITRVEVTPAHVVRDVIVYFDNPKHVQDTVAALKKLKGYKILAVEDEILRIHKGGKVAVQPLVRVESLSDLRIVYTPGVAQVCNYIVEHPQEARTYTAVGNSVCIATNGSAVLGLGDIGVAAAMPVMEGKSLILHKMADVSCVPLLIDSSDADRIVDILEGIAKTFSVIMIEDVKAPLCFEVEEKLQKRVSIPVFHDDQHGTATVILAALIRALKMTGNKKQEVRIVINGAGAAAMAAAKMLIAYGFRHSILCDSAGPIYSGRTNGMNPYKEEIARCTNSGKVKGTLADAMKGADVFIGLSLPGLVTSGMVRSMKKKPIVFPMANPVPEIWPYEALAAGAAISLDGRTINNALAFPGIIRGTLDAGAPLITYKMKFAAAETLAALAGKNEIVPDFMDPAVHRAVASAVRAAAEKSMVRK
jgi:malate dehydrogenase (oxaloacetate-decarboxylating)